MLANRPNLAKTDPGEQLRTRDLRAAKETTKQTTTARNLDWTKLGKERKKKV